MKMTGSDHFSPPYNWDIRLAGQDLSKMPTGGWKAGH